MHLVKEFRTHKYRFLIPILAVISLLTSCNDTGDLGMDLLPTTDLIEVKSLIEKDNIQAFTFSEDSIQTDEPVKSLLGSFNDPVFGLTTINLATQFRLLDKPEYGDNPVADSVKLVLYYSSVYGDIITLQTFTVYELESSLDVDATYAQNVDLKALTSDIAIGQFTHTPIIELDSTDTDTLFQPIIIPVDVSLGQKLLDATEEDLASNDAFLQYFKGLLIESAVQPTEGGSILTLED